MNLPWPLDSTHARVLTLIRLYQPIARNRLAEIAGLSPSTVTHVVRDLRNEGLVLETGSTPTGRVGRDPIQLEINGDAYCAIGVQIGDSRLIGLLLNLKGEVLRRLVTPVPSHRTLKDLIPLVAQTVDQLIPKSPPLLGVGIAVAGMINRVEGTVFANNLHDVPVDLQAMLTERIEREVIVDNEANAMLLAEQTCGVLRNSRNALSVNVGLGIGGGILIDGRLYAGDNGGAGEIGHSVVQIDGPLCSCGNRGCLETFSGGIAFSRAPRLDEASELSAEAILRAAEQTPDGRYHLETAARVLGIGLSNAANVFNPETIVIGGSHFSVYRPVMETFLATFRRHVLPYNANVSVLDSSLTEPEALGAGISMLNRFFGTTDTQSNAAMPEHASEQVDLTTQ